MKTLLFLLTLIYSTLSLAQNIRIENAIYDENGDPLPFAYVVGRSIGVATVSNEDGKFSLSIPEDKLDSNLLFSFLGYKVEKLSIREIQAAKDGIHLVPSTVKIKMVEVKPTKMETVKSLLKKIRKNIVENYPIEPYELEGYYRESLREKGEFIRYADAAVKLELDGYQKKKYKWKDYYRTSSFDIMALSSSGSGCERLHRYHFHDKSLKTEKALIVNSRASIDNGESDVKANIEAGPLGIFTKDELKYKSSFLAKDNLDHFNFTLEEINVPEYGWLYQLKFKSTLDTSQLLHFRRLSKEKKFKEARKIWKEIKDKKNLEGEIWVRKDNFAIIHLSYWVPKTFKPLFCTCKSMTINHFDFKVSIDYQEKNGKYIPTYLKHEDEFLYEDTLKQEVIPFLATSEFYLTEQHYNIEPKIKAMEAFGNVDANQLFDYPLEYDSAFWQNYHQENSWSIVPDSLVESISKDTALEAQFYIKHIRDENLKPPIAKKVSHSTSIHGYTLNDPYAWLKDTKNPKANAAVMEYLKAENAYTDNYFIPLRESQRNLYKEMLSRIDQTYESMPVRIEDWFYSTQYLEDKQYPIYRRKKKEDKEWEVLFDVNKLAENQSYYSLGGINPNPSQEIIAFYENTTGSDLSTLKFKQINENKILSDSLIRISNIVWLTDSTFIYTVQEKQTNRTYQIKHHTLFTKQTNDKVIFEEKDPRFSLGINKSRSKKYIYLSSDSKEGNEVYYMPADSDSLLFFLVEPQMKNVHYSLYDEGEQFYIHSNRYREDFDLRVCPIKDCAAKKWKTFYKPEKEVILHDFLFFPKHIAFIESDRMEEKLLVMNRETQEIEEVKFEEDVYSVYLSYNDKKETDSLTFGYESMKTPTTIYRMNLSNLEKRKVRQDTVKNIYASKWIKQKRVFAKAHDGEEIPITLLYRSYLKGNKNELKRTYLTAYGSYGSSSTTGFNSTLYSLIHRGFIVAIAHVRGGGELGLKWYEDGKLLNKKNTFTDFIDCTEYLIDKGYAVKGNIVASGGSAGGLLMGAVANMAPELYHTIILNVPFVDVINTMLDESLPLTTGEYLEWGNPNEKEYFDYIRSYSPYDNVKAQNYPNMLFFTGINDQRVGYWEPAKMVAKLRATKTDDNLILLKTDLSSGHGGGSGRFAGIEQLAYKYALLFDLLKRDFLQKVEEK